jgi:hypothetical protein
MLERDSSVVSIKVLQKVITNIFEVVRDHGDHPKAAIDYHFKTGHREAA